jgi:hypothetical protein
MRTAKYAMVGLFVIYIQFKEKIIYLMQITSLKILKLLKIEKVIHLIL